MPTIVRPRTDFSGTRHRPSGKFRMNGDRVPPRLDRHLEARDGRALLLPGWIRVARLLMPGPGLSRTAVRRMVADGLIRLPPALDAEAHQDFEFTVLGVG